MFRLIRTAIVLRAFAVRDAVHNRVNRFTDRVGYWLVNLLSGR